MKDICKYWVSQNSIQLPVIFNVMGWAVARFNWTLITMIRKHAMKFGVQWDQYLHRILWAYNTPHSSTREKLSYLLFGFEYHFPTEAALLSDKQISPTNVSDYWEELTLNMSSAKNFGHEDKSGSPALLQRVIWYNSSTINILKLVIGFLYTSPIRKLGRWEYCHDHGMDPTELWQEMILTAWWRSSISWWSTNSSSSKWSPTMFFIVYTRLLLVSEEKIWTRRPTQMDLL